MTKIVRASLGLPTLRAGPQFQNSKQAFVFEYWKTPMYLAPQDNDMPPLASKDCVTNRHPGQVSQSGTRAGIQKEFDYIELSLDSGSRLPLADSFGMTGSANCDIVSKGRRDCCGVKCIGVYWNLRFICNLVLGIWDFGTRIWVGAL